LVIQRREKGAKNAGNRLGHPPGATPLVFNAVAEVSLAEAGAKPV